MARERALYHGWVLVSYLILCGAILTVGIPVAIVVKAAGLEVPWILFVIGAAGSFGGAWSAARVSPHRRALEPATAVVLVVVSVAAALFFDPLGQWRGHEVHADVSLGLATAGALVLVFGWLGAFWAVRRRRPPFADTGRRAFLLSFLVHAGLFFVAMLAFLIVSWGTDARDGDIYGVQMVVLLLGMFGGALLGGMVTQLVTPTVRRGRCASGAGWVYVLFIAVSVMEGELAAVFGLVTCAIVATLLSYGGVAIALHLRARRPKAPLAPAEVLSAAERDRG